MSIKSCFILSIILIVFASCAVKSGGLTHEFTIQQYVANYTFFDSLNKKNIDLYKELDREKQKTYNHVFLSGRISKQQLMEYSYKYFSHRSYFEELDEFSFVEISDTIDSTPFIGYFKANKDVFQYRIEQDKLEKYAKITSFEKSNQKDFNKFMHKISFSSTGDQCSKTKAILTKLMRNKKGYWDISVVLGCVPNEMLIYDE